MKIPDQKIALQEKINEYDETVGYLISVLGNVRISEFDIAGYHRKKLNIDLLITNAKELKKQLQEAYDEYTYLNELYKDEYNDKTD